MNESDDDASQSALLAWHDRVSALHGARVALPPRAEWDARAYRQLCGERARARERHSLFVVVLHCGKPGREHMVARWREGYLKTKRHVFASDRTDVALGTLGFPDDPGVPHRDFRTAGRYPGAHRPLTAIVDAPPSRGGGGGDAAARELRRLVDGGARGSAPPDGYMAACEAALAHFTFDPERVAADAAAAGLPAPSEDELDETASACRWLQQLIEDLIDLRVVCGGG